MQKFARYCCWEHSAVWLRAHAIFKTTGVAMTMPPTTAATLAAWNRCNPAEPLQHPRAQQSIREHSRACANLASLPLVLAGMRARITRSESIRQHTPAYVSILAGMRARITRSEQGSSSSDAVHGISAQRHAIRHHLVPPHTPNSRCVRPPPRTLRA